jgi:hypothetical protein
MKKGIHSVVCMSGPVQDGKTITPATPGIWEVVTNSDDKIISPKEMETARNALKAASIVIIGYEITEDDESIKFYSQYNDPENKIASGNFKFADACELYKGSFNVGNLSLPFARIYGRYGYPDEVSPWIDKKIDKKAWYVTIYASEFKRYQNDPYLKRTTIERAYLFSMGRVPTESDLKYWMGRTATYKEIVNIARVWLYSKNGKEELEKMIVRAQPNAKNNSGSAFVALARKKHLLFAEVLEMARMRDDHVSKYNPASRLDPGIITVWPLD